MKLFVVLLFALVVVASSQRKRITRPRIPVRRPFFFPPMGESVYAASLGGAPVGLYSRTGGLGGSGVEGASLGGAPVGMYSRERGLPLMG